MRAYQLPAEQDAQNNGRNRQALNPAVGFNQLGRRQQLGQDAVLGRRVRRSTQAHDGIGQQRMPAKEHHQTAHNFDTVAHQHDLPLRPGVRNRAYKRGQHHIKQCKQGHQECLLPLGRLGIAQQLHRCDKQRVVCQRAKKLRGHDGEKTAFHAVAGGVGCMGEKCRRGGG